MGISTVRFIDFPAADALLSTQDLFITKQLHDLLHSKQYRRPELVRQLRAFPSENPKNFSHSTRFDRQKIPALI